MTINLSQLFLPIFFAICFVAFVGIVIILMTFSVRSRLKYAKRIKDAQARGAFDDMNTPSRRNLWLASIALVGLLGVVATLGMFFLQLLHVVALPVEVLFIAFGVFGSMIAIAGTLMQREIDRRL
jgi:divalent metal cation (Fe/Co/Zn/Cd) transporter